MNLSYEPVNLPEQRDRLVTFLSGEEWPFHVNLRLSREKVLAMIDQGTFDRSNHKSFWILGDSVTEIGFIRLIDLDDVDDGYPLFDLRIKNAYRGRGFGTAAVVWLTNYLFECYPQLDRIAGTTRADNLAMRKTFLKCGYVKEGHSRKDWSDSSGRKYDSTKFAMIREDWESGSSTPVNWNDEQI